MKAATYQPNEKGTETDGQVYQGQLRALDFVGRIDVLVDVSCRNILTAHRLLF